MSLKSLPPSTGFGFLWNLDTSHFQMFSLPNKLISSTFPGTGNISSAPPSPFC